MYIYKHTCIFYCIDKYIYVQQNVLFFIYVKHSKGHLIYEQLNINKIIWVILTRTLVLILREDLSHLNF